MAETFLGDAQCEAAYVNGGCPLSEVQLQSQCEGLPEQANMCSQSMSYPGISPENFLDLIPMQQLGKAAESSKPKASSTGSAAYGQAFECESRPSIRGDTENMRPTVYSWQVGHSSAGQQGNGILGHAQREVLAQYLSVCIFLCHCSPCIGRL